MRLDIRMLGGFQVVAGGTPVPAAAWRQRRATELVQLLALASNHRLHREQLIDTLWPDLPPDAGAANLHKAAHHARRALGSRDAVVLRSGMVALCPDGEVVTDVGRFEAAAGTALGSGDPTACAAAADLHRGELLPARRYDDWAARPRQALRRLQLELLRGAGRWERVVALDPADEAAHLELLRRHAAGGDVHAALRQFHRLRAALRHYAGAPPSPRAVALYRELIERLAVAAAPTGAPPLVGREVELARLRAALRAGRPTTVLVSGEQGAGKTRLVEEALGDAAEAGLVVLRGTGGEAAGGLPYAPVTGAIERLLAGRPDLNIPAATRATLRRLAGEAGERLPRQRVLAAIDAVLAASSGVGGVVLWLDDLQAADAATVQLLSWLRRNTRRRATLLLSYRSRHDNPELERLRADFVTGESVEVALGPLHREEAAALLAEATPTRLATGVAGKVWALAGGNPSLTLALAGAVAPDGSVRVPESVVSVAEAELGRLDPPAREMLGRVALAGAELAVDELVALAGLPEEEALARLDEALAAGVLEASGSAYRFRLPLARHALLRGLAPHQRRAAHAAAAARLAASGRLPARAAEHYLAAGDERQAVPHLRAAAELAAALGAHRDALRLVDRARGIDPARADLLTLRADLLFALAEPTAPAAYAAAASVSTATRRDGLRLRQAWALLTVGDVEGAAGALRLVPEVEMELRARRVVTAGMLAWFRGGLDEAERAADEARELTIGSGSTQDLLHAALLQSLVGHSRGDWPERLWLDVFDPRLAGDLANLLADAHLCAAETYLERPEPFERLVAFAIRLSDAGARSGAPRAHAFASLLLGECALLSGRLGDAGEQLVASARLHRELGAAGGEVLALQRLAEAKLAAGGIQPASSLLDQALDAARQSPLSARHLLPRVYGTMVTAAGDPAAALALVGEGQLALAGPEDACPFCVTAFLTPAAIACAANGQLEQSLRLIEMAAGGLMLQRRGQSSSGAAVTEARGRLSLAQGDRARAAALFGEAADTFERCGHALAAARCRQAATTP